MNELVAYDPAQLSGPSDSARGPIVSGLVVLVAFFAGLGGWAAYAPLNGAVVAQAVVKVEGNRKSIQHLDGGIVKESHVRRGTGSTSGARRDPGAGGIRRAVAGICRPARH